MSDQAEQYASGWANVVAIDPGGTSGWSVMAVHPEAVLSQSEYAVLENVRHWAHGQVSGNEDDQAAELLELIEAWPDAAVVIEDFTLREFRTDRDLLSPVRVGARVAFGLRFWPGLGGIRNHTALFWQDPGNVLHTVTDDRLREWGFFQKAGGEVHARDADRHALYFLRRVKAGSLTPAEAWPELFGEEAEEE